MSWKAQPVARLDREKRRQVSLSFGQKDKTWRNTVSGIAKGQLLAI
jgi:hypothetical protein